MCQSKVNISIGSSQSWPFLCLFHPVKGSRHGHRPIPSQSNPARHRHEGWTGLEKYNDFSTVSPNTNSISNFNTNYSKRREKSIRSCKMYPPPQRMPILTELVSIFHLLWPTNKTHTILDQDPDRHPADTLTVANEQTCCPRIGDPQLWVECLTDLQTFIYGGHSLGCILLKLTA